VRPPAEPILVVSEQKEQKEGDHKGGGDEKSRKKLGGEFPPGLGSGKSPGNKLPFVVARVVRPPEKEPAGLRKR